MNTDGRPDPRRSIPVAATPPEPQGPPTVPTPAPSPPAPPAEGDAGHPTGTDGRGGGNGGAAGEDATAPPDGGEQGQQKEHRVTVYAALGGQAFFDRLVERFYEVVADDDVLLPLYPQPDDLGPARERLALFLGQYWGGPPAYSERRGHPRLRMRHAPYAIGVRERDHWLAAMRTALEATMPETPLEQDLRDQVAARMSDYFTMAAEHLVNRPGP